ncbi:MAG: hypothetical protein U0556_06460 [Dehalococcoidia bacterium]
MNDPREFDAIPAELTPGAADESGLPATPSPPEAPPAAEPTSVAEAATPRVVVATPRSTRLAYFYPLLGCLAVLCVFLSGLGGIVWSGVGPSVLAAASGNVVIRVVKVARIGADGQYHEDGGNVLSADNRGMAGRVIYERIPRGYQGNVIIIWERLDAAGATTEIRKPDVIAINDAMNGTTWWYALRQPFAPGHYQFSVALAGPTGQANRVGAVRFEVQAGPVGSPPAGAPAPTQPGYRPPTRPPAVQSPVPSPQVATPAVATATPRVVTATSTTTPLVVTATPPPVVVTATPSPRP